MDDLVTWLRAQLDEDERLARAAAAEGGPDWKPDSTFIKELVDPLPSQRRMDPSRLFLMTPEDAEHVARHDPARVLREVESKRRLIEQIGYYESKIDGEWGCCHDAAAILAGRCPDIEVGEIAALRLLAAVYADRPGYRAEEWKP